MAYSLEGLPEDLFPHPLYTDEDGLLGISSQLVYERVLAAYHFGIFPWYSEPYPVQWFFTQPRFVLFLEDLKISKSMRNVLNQGKFHASINGDFNSVIDNCAGVERKDQDGTWIGEDIKQIYRQLHANGYAHSAECYLSDKLVGGLYGIALGKIFFGESMYSQYSNASKIALISMVEHLRSKGYILIDCQQETKHLKSLGARLISGRDFWQLIKTNLLCILKETED